MKVERLRWTSVLFLTILTCPATAQPLSQQICANAQSFFGRNVPSGTEILLASTYNSAAAKWAPLDFKSSPLDRTIQVIYLAYFFSAPYTAFSASGQEATGAVSIKIAVVKDEQAAKTSTVELYRPAIPPGSNRCERGGRRAIEDRHVGINEYIDYHARSGSSSDVEDFHFQYPYGGTQCARTDRPQTVSDSFQFEDVKPISNDTVAALLFGRFFGVAYALNANDFSKLRTELHYYNRTNATVPTCVGFQIPLAHFGKTATVVINDLSSNWLSPRGSWLITRQ
jgi:hypothetical protein